MLLKKAGWLLSKNEDPSICEKSHFEKKFFLTNFFRQSQTSYFLKEAILPFSGA